MRHIAERLLARQIVCPSPVASLDQLAGSPALRNGRRFAAQSAIACPDVPGLFKVGLEGDTTPIGTERAQNGRATLDRSRNPLDKVRRYLLGTRPHKFWRLAAYGLARLSHKLQGRPAGCRRSFAWSLTPGVNFLQVAEGGFVCLDHGGIYEDRLCSRGAPFPSQVGMDLYTTSNAAFLFQWCGARDPGNPAWSEAVIRPPGIRLRPGSTGLRSRPRPSLRRLARL